MSVFSKFTNFIRHTKNAVSGDKYETAARIVEEERQAKRHLPSYTGLERYQLLEKIGDGAFSIVYKGLDTETNEKVAIKVVDQTKLKREQKASVLKEIRIMQTLKHPSIVRMLAYHETSTHFFLILELCEGGELFNQIVKLTYFSEDLARHCIRQVAEGLRYLHEERGVVHRDIKPENLLFDPIPFMERTTSKPPLPDFDDESKLDEGEFVEGVGGGGIGKVKIADFGLSKVVWDQHTMTPCGTVGYTAPEIVKDQRYSKSVDCYALGCVLYVMLCGFPPFYDEDISELTQKVAKGQYEFLSPWWDVVSDSAKDLITHTLFMNPRKRYTIDQFLQHPWMLKKPHTTKESRKANDTTEEQTEQSELVDQESEAEQIKLKYQQRKTTSSGRSTPTERRRMLEPSMKEVYGVCLDMARGVEEKKLKKRAKKQPHMFVNSIYNVDDDEEDDNDDDDDSTSSGSSNSDDNEDSSSEPSTEDNGQTDLEIEALQHQLNQMMSAEQVSQTTQTVQDVENAQLAQRRKEQPSQQTTTNDTIKRVKVRKPQPLFELKMDHATLLEKRRKNVPLTE
ncbi:kinase [Halteromyces radiatus]|uniref:kinase n=1 Tax=Halteromyces radiatus TaxID=101107 RepID=UPI00221FD0A7|nr:kinase [Halteromyces radiatus]KAI8100063.1 kinase [Halteromyces radiatus]